MAQKDTKPNNQSKYLSDSDSDDNEIDPRLKTSIEERQYNTIPGSTIATQIALSHSRAQANPTMERGSPWKGVQHGTLVQVSSYYHPPGSQRSLLSSPL